MEHFNRLLLDVWREACRHVEIGAALAESAPLLFQSLGIDLVMVRRFDLQRRSVDTVAVGRCRPGNIPSNTRTDCTPDELEALLAWSRVGELYHSAAAHHSAAPHGLLPEAVKGDVLVGPLNTDDGPVGLVLFVAHAPHEFRPRHRDMLAQLLEPFTIWLENDRRLRELEALREAAEADNRSLRSRLGKHDISELIVGAETGLKPVMERVELVARTDVPVLIFGETGSGKEVVARSIHQNSRRVSGPFLRVNCGAIPSELVDSELFGHERGSFTGAVGDRKGWFERADGGTLFLDECGELPMAAQVRLLRILQDGSFERVGAERQSTVDVRVIAATHRDLQGMVAEGTFREDLWYRLAVFPLRLPALRDRVEDIPKMAAHFATRAAQRLGMPLILPSPGDINLLVTYRWPGNVRELSAVIERAVILGDGKRLEVATALGAAPTQSPTVAATVSAERSSAVPPPHAGEFASLDLAMARHIEAALVRTRGRIEGARGAAELLGINPHTLRARMRKLGLDWGRFRERD